MLFAPHLRGKPVVVLSHAEGCIVTRSKEAKALGIAMGAPAFQYAEVFKREGVKALCPNYALYSDMSHRVMSVLSFFTSEIEQYSIDEAFLLLDVQDPLTQAMEIQHKVLQWTGIPVSVGIGVTKTLAKLANDIAKKRQEGVFAIDQEENALFRSLCVQEVWGVGSQLTLSLRSLGIDTVLDLKNASDGWIKHHFSLTLLKTVWELRGISCLPVDAFRSMRKSVTCARSFAVPVTALQELEEALASYVANVAQTLREEKLMASFATLFITTSPHRTPHYANSITLTWEEPTDYPPFLISKAKNALGAIYRTGYLYKKAGITLGGIVTAGGQQLDLFRDKSIDEEKRLRMLSAYEEVRRHFGADALHFAAEGTMQRWRRKRDRASLRYTTCWDELLTVRSG